MGGAALRDLAPAVTLWRDTPEVELVRKGPTALVADYGSVATSAVLDLRAQRAEYLPAEKLFF